MPGGLFPDEAANGLDINLMPAGHVQPVFLRALHGREGQCFFTWNGSASPVGHGVGNCHVGFGLVGVLACAVLFFGHQQNCLGWDIGDRNIRR